MRFLIVTWGNPWKYDVKLSEYIGFNWEIVKYHIKCEDGILKCKARSTLPLLYDYFRPNKVFIVVLDTIAEHYEDTYCKLIKLVIEKYREFLKELGLNGSNFQIIVAPGVGVFPNGLFEGAMEDFYAYILYRLVEGISNLIADELEICLDLTHGINFMPTLTYRAVKELAGIIALAANVRLRVYNSEPYVRGVNELRVHLIEDSRIRPNPCTEALSHQLRFLKRVELEKEKFGELCRSLREEFNKNNLDREELNAFLGSIVNGLPLVLYTFSPDRDSIEAYLKYIEKCYKGYISMQPYKGIRPHVKRLVSFSRDFIVMSKILLTSSVLGLKRRYEVPIEELDTVRRKIFSYHDRLNAMISNDLYQIREALRSSDKEPSKWIQLKEVLMLKGEYSLRNFLAHSGLEGNVTLVNIAERKLKYNLNGYIEHKGIRELILHASSHGLITN